ncbi:MAG: DNA translocase SftA [Candidatus Izimaplasma bacterium HR2]|nr:MAG: DNA translocase SftA [Candidatus Izimaplasma bacterium HR2]
MFFKKKRSVEAVTNRTDDTVPFVVPQIKTKEEKSGYKANRFVSPIFGTKVKDEVVIPTPYSRTGDLDRQLDSFRTKKKLTKEDMKRKYGSEYPEFDLISGNNLEEAMEKQNGRNKETPKYESYDKFEERIEETKPTEVIEDDYKEVSNKSKTSISDFFDNKPEVKPVKKEVKRVEKVSMNKFNKEYRLPPFSLLTKPVKKPSDSGEWINKQIESLNKTFKDMSVGAHVYTHTKGPTVTRYEIILDSGVNVRKITSISDNIKMALAAKEIRIEAPIPGKSTVGIEVPNEVAEIVHFIDIVNQDKFINSNDALNVAIGLDIDGKGVYTSIVKMPHGLVAGATGSGKSVCINTILMSLLFKYSPDHLKLMLIDPKMVELSAYNELPHLLTPVITDAKIATAGLKWAVEEMESRFVTFSNERVKDIVSYNDKVNREGLLEIMPYIVIVVDELADLMMIASSSVESSIMRLTQKARACGIHLIIATQRPSTDVVKGTIKSNIPTRIAFMVSSYIDSMTIIDSAGADKLLGRGDMLFAESGKPQIRVQGAYISDIEIQNVNEFIRRQRSNEYFFDQEKLVNKAASSSQYDELFAEVARYVVMKKEASINKISKEFRVGFNRAQKIVEMLSEMGIVSDNVGSKARSVLVTETELDELLSRK